MDTSPQDPDKAGVAKAIESFIGRHGLRESPLIDAEAKAIDALASAHDAITLGFARLDDKALEDPTVGLLLNMLHRNFEHAEAAITAFVTGGGSSAEVVARASLETSINIAYILQGDRLERLTAWLHHYVDGVDRQVGAWKTAVAGLGEPERKLHEDGAARRLLANETLRGVLSAFGKRPAADWPSIAERFAGAGEAIPYRTSYARLCSEAHGDAEATLHYFVGKITDEAVMNGLALETVMMSRFFIHYAVYMYLKSAFIYAVIFNMTCIEAIKQLRSRTESDLIEISGHMGAGF